MYLSSEEFLFGTKCPLLADSRLVLLSPERVAFSIYQTNTAIIQQIGKQFTLTSVIQREWTLG